MLVSFARSTVRSSRFLCLRALAARRPILFSRRPLSFNTPHTHPVDFQERPEKIPPLSHPEAYKPDDMYEDEFEYGIASDPNETEDEFEITPKQPEQLRTKKAAGVVEEKIVHLKHGHETLVDHMPLMTEFRLHGTKHDSSALKKK